GMAVGGGRGFAGRDRDTVVEGCRPASLLRRDAQERSRVRARTIADGGPPDGRRIVGPPHGEALVQRQAGLLAGGEGPRRGRVSPPVGGGRAYTGGHGGAALVYQRGQPPITVFISPAGESPDSRGDREWSFRGFNLVHWCRSGACYDAVSDLNLPELRELARDL